MNRIGLFCLLFLISGDYIRAKDVELTFEKDVHPILKANCTLCHGEEVDPKGGVDLRLRRFMDAPLGNGKTLLVPGHPEKSELIGIIERGEMPEKGHPVPAADLDVIRRWIAQGAKTARPEPEVLAHGSIITEEERAHWAFQPVKRPSVPATADSLSPIDAFLSASMKAQGLDFAPEADRATLLRRLTINLTGLVPTPTDLENFLNDTAPDAYEKVVDRLLASQEYGERWGRHWLDVAGYADSNGYAAADSLRPHAWRYRDYVIRAFNEDKPWDEFILEQLAGDELAGITHGDYRDAIQDPTKRDQFTATAFLRMAPDGTGDPNDDPKLARNQVIAEQLKIVSSSMLGLTVACAQCHDHRLDPISHEDYFRFRAIFDPAYDWEAWRPPAARNYSLYTLEEHALADEFEKAAKFLDKQAQEVSKNYLDEIFEIEVLKLPEEDREPYRAARATATKLRTPEQAALIKKYPSALALYSLNLYSKEKHDVVLSIQAEAKKVRDMKPTPSFVMALAEVKGKVPASKLHLRGDHSQPDKVVTPGELSILAKDEVKDLTGKELPSGSTGRRLAYAQWLTNGEHPLVARVLVNRFWMHHFGRGIVSTVGDFGLSGDRPSHPELLDYLADEFVKNGWKLKSLHRSILLSRAYRQAAQNPKSIDIDRDNVWLARYPMRRLEAEPLRDSVLATAGTLVSKPYGPASLIARDPAGRVVTGIDKGTISKAQVEPGGDQDYRRSVYVQVRRSQPLTVLEAFDSPVMEPHCEVRAQTTVAPQSLLLMNDTFILEHANKLADRLHRESPDDEKRRLQLAWQLLFGQQPTEEELSQSQEYLKQQIEAISQYHAAQPAPKAPAKGAPQPAAPDPAKEALASLCQVLYSSNRFLYVE